MQVWGIRTKFGGDFENNEFKITRGTHAYVRIVFFRKLLGSYSTVKSYGITFYRSPEINPELYDPGIVFFSKPRKGVRDDGGGDLSCYNRSPQNRSPRTSCSNHTWSPRTTCSTVTCPPPDNLCRHSWSPSAISGPPTGFIIDSIIDL